MCGGKRWLIEDNIFINNGDNDPAAHVDYEDGWESAGLDIWRNNTFDNSGQFVLCAGHSLTFHNNKFKCHVDNRVRTQFSRWYLNTFDNDSTWLSTQTDMVFAQNLILNKNYTITGQNYHGDKTQYEVRALKNYVKN